MADKALPIPTSENEDGGSCVLELHLDGTDRGQLWIYPGDDFYRCHTTMTRNQALQLAASLIKIWGEEPHPHG